MPTIVCVIPRVWVSLFPSDLHGSAVRDGCCHCTSTSAGDGYYALVQDLLGSIPVCAGRRGCGWPVLSVARFPCVIGTGWVLCSTHCRQADWCSVTQMKYNCGKVTQLAHCGQAQLSKLRQVSALFIFFGDYSSQVHGC